MLEQGQGHQAHRPMPCLTFEAPDRGRLQGRGAGGLAQGSCHPTHLTTASADALQRPLRSRFRQQLRPGVRLPEVPCFLALLSYNQPRKEEHYVT
jgi:hypothetical protein